MASLAVVKRNPPWADLIERWCRPSGDVRSRHRSGGDVEPLSPAGHRSLLFTIFHAGGADRHIRALIREKSVAVGHLNRWQTRLIRHEIFVNNLIHEQKESGQRVHLIIT